MLEDANVDIVLTQARTVTRLPASAVRSICIDADGTAITRQPDTPPEGRVAAVDLAYIMYTSGSGGAPKGVAVPHRGVVRLVTRTGYASFGSDEVFLHLAPASFAPPTFQISCPLL